MIEYSPSQRYAILGKSGSGKTVFTIVLASLLVPHQVRGNDWECWWIDTKDDRRDIRLLKSWGFLPPAKNNKSARKLLHVRGSRADVYAQCQEITERALSQRGVLLVFDEYNHVCKNRIDAGPQVENAHKRGRGLDVGTIGEVQEPVLVPRAVFSQANHLFIFGLTHLRDIKIAREMNPAYAPDWPGGRPDTVPDRHGFWSKYLDGYGSDGAWHYYPHVAGWRSDFDG